jgi:hypothetical protein
MGRAVADAADTRSPYTVEVLNKALDIVGIFSHAAPSLSL